MGRGRREPPATNRAADIEVMSNAQLAIEMSRRGVFMGHFAEKEAQQ
jgi:hypothetical protein